jgi:hypothetical protein
MIRIAATVAIPWVLLSCQAEPDGSGTVNSSDSAGVSIVSSSAPAWSDNSAWRIQSDPVVDIGIESGEDAYQLNRVFDALRLPDGSVLVGNSGRPMPSRVIARRHLRAWTRRSARGMTTSTV